MDKDVTIYYTNKELVGLIKIHKKGNKMQTELDDRLPLIAYSMDEFLIKVQEGIRAGYELNYNNQNGYPKNYIGLYEITLFKSQINAEEVSDSDSKDVPVGTQGNEQVISKVGRPKKNKEGDVSSEA